MSLTPGTRLGPYEIVAPLGAGGMGEVYRARDTRLGRDVAVKVLPQHLSDSPEVRSRFEREARTVSSLNHPHICVLHDVGREGGTDYLVLELVEGETLADRLARGALPLADVLRLGAQIADALDRAHRAGVIHRDLKPGNVMLTKSGAKLLDFGLARAAGLAAPSQGGFTQSPTMAQPLTAEGTIVGTFQYMAPEQLEGAEADARADLWSLGCVLYEMSTGRRAFDGSTQASLISSIMRDQPRPMAELSPVSPPALERLVRQCLAKDPDERWQSAGDVRRELEWIGASSAVGAAAVAGAAGPARRRLPAGAAGLAAGAAIAIAALAWAFGPWSARRADPPLVRFMVDAPPGMRLSQPAEAAVSPDGRLIVFAAFDSTGKQRLHLRALASPEARVLPGTEDGALPFWSPDGRQVAFFASEKLLKVGLDGNPPVALCDAKDPRGGSWSPRGVIVFAPNSEGPLSRVSTNGGAPVPVTKLRPGGGEIGHRYPQFLPDGRHFLYASVDSSEERVTYATSLDGEKPVEVCRGGSGAVYLAPGWLLYLDGNINTQTRRLLAKRFDAGSRRASGEAQLVIDDVNANNFAYSNVSGDAHGTLVVQHWGWPLSRLEWQDWRGASLAKVPEDFQGVSQAAAVSPDAGRLAYAGARGNDLFVRDLATGIDTRLTFTGQAVTSITWSPDGRRIAFARLSAGRGWEIRVKAADGSGPDSLLFRGPGLFATPQKYSPDGRWLLAQVSDAAGNFDLWKIPTDGGKAEPYDRTPGTEESGELSADGRWIATVVTENGKRNLYVQSFPTPGAKFQVGIPDVAGATWRGNGTRLLVANTQGVVYSVSVSTAAGFQQGAPTVLRRLGSNDYVLDFDPAGDRLLIAIPKDASATSQLEVVLGWPHLLDAK